MKKNIFFLCLASITLSGFCDTTRNCTTRHASKPIEKAKALTCFCWHPVATFGNIIATGDTTGTVTIWDWETGTTICSIQTESPIVHAIAFCHVCENVIAIGGNNRTVELWDWKAHVCLKKVTLPEIQNAKNHDAITILSWHPQIPKTLLLGTSNEQTVYICDVPKALWKKLKSDSGTINYAAWHPTRQECVVTISNIITTWNWQKEVPIALNIRP